MVQGACDVNSFVQMYNSRDAPPRLDTPKRLSCVDVRVRKTICGARGCWKARQIKDILILPSDVGPETLTSQGNFLVGVGKGRPVLEYFGAPRDYH